MKLESNTATVNKPQEVVFDFLADFRNFEALMPKDKVSKWTATEDTCSFNINGMADIGMKIVQRDKPESIHIVSHGKNPFEFTLQAKLNQAGKDQTEVRFLFDAQVNPFLKMMVEKPLGNFFNMLADKLKEVFA